jgi:hypothetical protein
MERYRTGGFSHFQVEAIHRRREIFPRVYSQPTPTGGNPAGTECAPRDLIPLEVRTNLVEQPRPANGWFQCVIERLDNADTITDSVDGVHDGPSGAVRHRDSPDIGDAFE